ncbi:MAG TPA: hypothetical protein EYP56_20835 [Planctomycetaceae bacterium]|nr:hypothetical protein [Planctomycetaceae bacterium]
MQEDLNERTRQLEEAFGGRENLDRNARRQYEQLGHEQGRLADLLLRLLPPEPGPESLLEDLPIPENESP